MRDPDRFNLREEGFIAAYTAILVEAVVVCLFICFVGVSAKIAEHEFAKNANKPWPAVSERAQ